MHAPNQPIVPTDQPTHAWGSSIGGNIDNSWEAFWKRATFIIRFFFFLAMKTKFVTSRRRYRDGELLCFSFVLFLFGSALSFWLSSSSFFGDLLDLFFLWICFIPSFYGSASLFFFFFLWSTLQFRRSCYVDFDIGSPLTLFIRWRVRRMLLRKYSSARLSDDKTNTCCYENLARPVSRTIKRTGKTTARKEKEKKGGREGGRKRRRKKKEEESVLRKYTNT